VQSKPVFNIDIEASIDEKAENTITINFYEIGPISDDSSELSTWNMKGANSKAIIYPTCYKSSVDTLAIKQAEGTILSIFGATPIPQIGKEYMIGKTVDEIREQIVKETASAIAEMSEKAISTEARKWAVKKVINTATTFVGDIAFGIIEYNAEMETLKENIKLTNREFSRIKSATLFGTGLDCSATFVEYDTLSRQDITMNVSEGVNTREMLSQINDEFETNYTFEDVMKDPLPLTKLREDYLFRWPAAQAGIE
jgi:hypothetical protein